MKWSLRLFQIAGIGVYIHWTFLLLIGYLVVVHFQADENAASLSARVADSIMGVGFTLAVFACVLLHELGHAFAAMRYGVRTRYITLLPIGGVARLDRIPEEPTQELVVAIAGPAVNVAIAALLIGLLWITSQSLVVKYKHVVEVPFLVRLAGVNILLVVFNLLPAFPMDGGRVLRALLARRLEFARATHIAANVGQGMAVLFGVLGVFLNPLLLFIALFVFLGAESEARSTELRTFFRGVRVADAMMIDFHSMVESDTLGSAADRLLAGPQHDFPVVAGQRTTGVLVRGDIVRGLSEFGRDAPISAVMHSDWGSAQVDEALEDVVRRMREQGLSTLPVLRGDRMVGLITLENIGEWMMVQSVLHHTAPPDEQLLKNT